jgi:hypothetical protein
VSLINKKIKVMKTKEKIQKLNDVKNIIMKSFRSPKNKYSAEITTSKSLGNLGNKFILTSMSIDDLKIRIKKEFEEQAKKINAKITIVILENKKNYPEFNWVELEKYEI